MTQPLGNCPGCGADEPFEQVHAGECPDVAGECLEWACTGCGAGIIMGTIIAARPAGAQATLAVSARQSVRAA
jgi:hypothetical protein